jgi:hypothetical protein
MRRVRRPKRLRRSRLEKVNQSSLLSFSMRQKIEPLSLSRRELKQRLREEIQRLEAKILKRQLKFSVSHRSSTTI